MNTETIKQFPVKVQEEILDVLKGWSSVNVSFSNGKYHVSPDSMICATYAPDHKVFGEFFQKDIYTEEERVLNYLETFHDYPYPCSFKGNGPKGRELDNLPWGTKFQYNADGDIEILTEEKSPAIVEMTDEENELFAEMFG